ncbi:MAG: cytochrome c biogenesis protein CcdA [Bacteriovoracia bacterium]
MESITDFLSQMLSGQSGADLSAAQWVTALAICYLGGILASLTPCIYPMIPITVSVVGGMGRQATGRRRWREFGINILVYISGMAVVYAFMGVAAGLTGKVFGSITNTSGWYLGLGIVMALAALMMMDVIQFDPQRLWESFKRKFGGGKTSAAAHQSGEQKTTLLGAFALGASSGFIAAPCTTPVLTAVLAYIAKTQSIGMGFFMMIAFSLGLGTILILIATFAGALKMLPRSGNWMNHIKKLSGILLLAFAGYLVYMAGQRGGL